MPWLKLRASEWVLLGFFVYAAAIVPFFPDRRHSGVEPLIALATVCILTLCLSLLSNTRMRRIAGYARDWAPVLLTLFAFRQMEFFAPRTYDGRLEAMWIRWDHQLLAGLHLRAAIESLGPVFPSFLELCYLVVYGVPGYCIALLYLRHRRDAVDRVLTLYLLGTLFAYALFPYFPSLPPRLAYPELDYPRITTVLHKWNLFFLRQGSIHTGVYPSAHVSSVFSATWAFFFLLGRRRPQPWILLLYSTAVSIATIYGRYHYAADMLAGFFMSLIPGFLALLLSIQKSQTGKRTDRKEDGVIVDTIPGPA